MTCRLIASWVSLRSPPANVTLTVLVRMPLDVVDEVTADVYEAFLRTWVSVIPAGVRCSRSPARWRSGWRAPAR